MDGPNYLFPNDNSPGRKVIGHAANQSIRPYNTNQEYLYAMREDLADWFKGLYAVEINVNNFFEILETGTLLCQHANNITTCADYMIKHNVCRWTGFQGKYVRASSFFARDNIANFINWCRHEIEISESVMFETNDLVLRHNEKNVILCLLEVARRGSKFGVPAPVLVQMEEDIDKEIELEKEAKKNNRKPPNPPQQKVTCDFKSLDEMVQYILGMCTCPSQFPMVKVADGKYKVGDSESLIFMRILRQHVMVRVGGGWDTLEHYLNKHDPCRC
uniref:GAR domain-containing protein n=1 Tax=Ciona intestinalis TaxID=7719 RepID=H2XPE8_CIOIN